MFFRRTVLRLSIPSCLFRPISLDRFIRRNAVSVSAASVLDERSGAGAVTLVHGESIVEPRDFDLRVMAGISRCGGLPHETDAAAADTVGSLQGDGEAVGGYVVVTTNSHSIYENLATEEALLRGVVLHKGEGMLMLYVNTPCVVVGRNQNILREVAVRRAIQDRVQLARRSSGGGAVYHDAGNLCFSFFTHRSEYAPEKTIQILRAGLSIAFGLDPGRLTTTGRHDLFLDQMKITGSAMRVQRDIAFHHCTLLLTSSRDELGRYLKPEAEPLFFHTAAVGSVRSPVTTLELVVKKDHPELDTTNSLLDTSKFRAYMADFYRTFGKELMQLMDFRCSEYNDNNKKKTPAAAPLQGGEEVVAVAKWCKEVFAALLNGGHRAFSPSVWDGGQAFLEKWKPHLVLPSSRTNPIHTSEPASPVGSSALRPHQCSTSAIPTTDTKSGNAPFFLLDVLEGMGKNSCSEGFAFVDGEGRRTPSGEMRTLPEEVARTSSLDWLWNMPKFESVVAITREELRLALLPPSATDEEQEEGWVSRALFPAAIPPTSLSHSSLVMEKVALASTFAAEQALLWRECFVCAEEEMLTAQNLLDEMVDSVFCTSESPNTDVNRSPTNKDKNPLTDVLIVRSVVHQRLISLVELFSGPLEVMRARVKEDQGKREEHEAAVLKLKELQKNQPNGKKISVPRLPPPSFDTSDLQALPPLLSELMSSLAVNQKVDLVKVVSVKQGPVTANRQSSKPPVAAPSALSPSSAGDSEGLVCVEMSDAGPAGVVGCDPPSMLRVVPTARMEEKDAALVESTVDLPASCGRWCIALLLNAIVHLWKTKNTFNFMERV